MLLGPGKRYVVFCEMKTRNSRWILRFLSPCPVAVLVQLPSSHDWFGWLWFKTNHHHQIADALSNQWSSITSLDGNTFATLWGLWEHSLFNVQDASLSVIGRLNQPIFSPMIWPWYDYWSWLITDLWANYMNSPAWNKAILGQFP